MNLEIPRSLGGFLVLTCFRRRFNVTQCGKFSNMPASLIWSMHDNGIVVKEPIRLDCIPSMYGSDVWLDYSREEHFTA